MRKLEIADPEVMRIAIQQEIARSGESRYDHRLHGLLLVTGGQSCQQVAELFGEDRRTVQRWVKRFESHGLEGVREGERSGRPATLDAKQKPKTKQALQYGCYLSKKKSQPQIALFVEKAKNEFSANRTEHSGDQWSYEWEEAAALN